MNPALPVHLVGVRREEEPPGRTGFRLLAVQADNEIEARAIADAYLSKWPGDEITTCTPGSPETAERLRLGPTQVWQL